MLGNFFSIFRKSMKTLLSYEDWLLLSEESRKTFDEDEYVFMENGVIISKDTLGELKDIYGFTDNEIMEMIEDSINGEPKGPFKNWEWDE